MSKSKEKLTEAQRRALWMLRALERREIPLGGHVFDSKREPIDWTFRFDEPEARRSTRTQALYPWAVTISSAVAQRLIEQGLLVDRVSTYAGQCEYLARLTPKGRELVDAIEAQGRADALSRWETP